MSQYEVVIHEVAARHGVTVEALLGRRKYSPLPAARRAVCMRLREAGLSLPAIGRQLGGRDHTTILSYLRPKNRTAEKMGNA